MDEEIQQYKDRYE